MPRVLFKQTIVHAASGQVGNFIFELSHLVLESGDLSIAFAEEGFGLFVGDLDDFA